jgi:hypothetical protein
MFEQAREKGFGAIAIGREIAALPGPWPAAVLRGADRPPPSGPRTTDPRGAAISAIADVDRALPPRAAPAQPAAAGRLGAVVAVSARVDG